jgi:hypothetical protein
MYLFGGVAYAGLFTISFPWSCSSCTAQQVA